MQDAEPDEIERRRDIVRRAEIAHEYMHMVRMAECGDAASLWRKIEFPAWVTAIQPIDPPEFEFQPSKLAKDLLLSIPEKAKPILLPKLKLMPADKADRQSQSLREHRVAIVLLGRLQAAEILIDEDMPIPAALRTHRSVRRWPPCSSHCSDSSCSSRPRCC